MCSLRLKNATHSVQTESRALDRWKFVAANRSAELIRSPGMPTATVKVSNLSLNATKQDILDFFSFSGEIQHVELQRDGESSQIAFVTFKDHDALDTALLLSGALIANQTVTIVPAEEYSFVHGSEEQKTSPLQVAATEGKSEEKAQQVIATMLARGFTLGRDAMNMTKSFDEKHHLTANVSATVSSLDKKIGLSEKFNAGTTAVNQGMKSVDEKFQVSEKTKQAFAAAEQTVQNAGSSLMKNRYILTSATWVTGAFSKVAKAANDVTQKTKEKVQSSQLPKNEPLNQASDHVDHGKEDELSHLS